MRRLLLLMPLVLAACTGGNGTAPIASTPPPLLSGLDRVMGRPAGELRNLFGEADLDVREGASRKLQFTSSVCVLDTYLYPAQQGHEPTVRHIDARRPDGADFDRASCIAALSRRTQAR